MDKGGFFGIKEGYDAEISVCEGVGGQNRSNGTDNFLDVTILG